MFGYHQVFGVDGLWDREPRSNANRYYTGEDWNAGRHEGTGYGGCPRWVFPDNPQNRRREEWPYSYSDFYIWGTGQEQKGISAQYHDRMQQQDYEKFSKLFKKYNENCYGIPTWGAKKCSAFLSEFWGKKINCVGLSEGCNVSSGYPYWVFYYKEIK